MDSNWDERRPRKNVHMYGRLIVCTRVPACKSSALATSLPNPGQEARLHYMCGQGASLTRYGMSHAIRSIHGIGKENAGRMEEGETFFLLARTFEILLFIEYTRDT